jgi:uncharacterized protein
MRHSFFVAATLAAALVAADPTAALNPNVPSAGLPAAIDYSGAILPERAGVVSWKTLAQVQPVKQGGKMVPEFSKDILALDRTDVKIQGFMIPLDMGDKQKRFLITAVPPHCSFCLPAGPDAIVEVVARKEVRYGFEPIVVVGRLIVLKDDAAGLLYRLTDAEQVEVVNLAPVAAPTVPRTPGKP